MIFNKIGHANAKAVLKNDKKTIYSGQFKTLKLRHIKRFRFGRVYFV